MYKEDIIKDTAERKNYAAGLEKFLTCAKEKAREKRDAFMTPRKYKLNSEAYREKFIGMLGYPLVCAPETPELIEKKFVVKDGNVNIYRMVLGFFGNTVPFYGIYFEQADKKDAPFVIGLHGGEGTPELISGMHLDSANYNNLVQRIISRGASVFAPQLLLWNKETYGTEYNRVETDGKLRRLGGSMTAAELYFLRGCLNYFISREGVNADKTGAAGMSYGGMYALHLAAANTRIKSCLSSSWVCDGFVRSWADWCYFGAENTFAVAETMALVCPRALVVGMGTRDELFDFELTEKECERAEPFYKEFSAADKFKLVVYDGAHEVNKGDDEIDFFFDELQK